MKLFKIAFLLINMIFIINAKRRDDNHKSNRKVGGVDINKQAKKAFKQFSDCVEGSLKLQKEAYEVAYKAGKSKLEALKGTTDSANTHSTFQAASDEYKKSLSNELAKKQDEFNKCGEQADTYFKGTNSAASTGAAGQAKKKRKANRKRRS